MRRYIRQPLFLFYLLLLYVVTQFSWWLYLISSLYGKIYTDPELLEKKTWMLVGEGSVFVIIVMGGAFMIRRAYQKETQLNRMQENFLLSVSHELKTPISSVTLYLQTLQKRELTENKREEIYTQSLSEIKRLESLVTNLLLTRGIENKNYYLNKTNLNLKDLTENVLESLKPMLQNHKVEVSGSDMTLLSDPEAMTSIFTNLLQNSSKYAPVNSCIQIDIADKENFVWITISDEGIGIPDEKKQQAFQRFYRDENEMTRKSKGTGLGLFITRYLVELHQGEILLEDNHPKGLRVKMKFPKN